MLFPPAAHAPKAPRRMAAGPERSEARMGGARGGEGFLPPLNLTLGAEERRAVVDLYPYDGAAAPAARLPFAVVHLVLELELPDLPEQVAVLLVGERRAAVLHRVLQRLDQGPVEPAD